MSKLMFEKTPSAPASEVGKTAPVIDVQATPVAEAAPVAAAETASVAAVEAAPDLAPVATMPGSAAVVPTNVSVPATTQPPMFDDENISFDDIVVPRMNLVQKVGDLSNIFNPGEIVLNQTLVIHQPANKEKNVVGTGPLLITPLGFKKTAYVEKVKGGGRGAYCLSREEVVRLGGTLDYREWKASNGRLKRFEPLATALFLIQRPAHIPDEHHQVFTHEIDGQFYALAFWSMKGTAYTHAAKHFFTARKITFLQRPAPGAKNADGTPKVDRGYPAFAWTLTTKLEPFNGDDGATNYVIVPVLTPGPKNSDALLTYVKEGIGLK